MTSIASLITPPSEHPSKEDQYRYDNSVYETLDALTYLSNPSILSNADFNTLGTNGTTPITAGDGDNAEFSDQWKVVGAGVATYTITPTPYPTGAITGTSTSTVPTASNYY